LHFRLSNCHAHDAECQKSEREALKSKASARAKEAEMQDNTRWCWLYDRNTDLDFPERSVEQKFSTPGTLFIPRLSVKLHLKVCNNFYSYINASPDQAKQVKEIAIWSEQIKKHEERSTTKGVTAIHYL
jgi:hypothetical protein